MLLGQLSPHLSRQLLQIAPGDLILVLPIQPAESGAALTAMSQAAQVHVQLLESERSHLVGTRLEDGRLTQREAVLPTPEARIGQADRLAETSERPAHLLLQSV